MEKIEDEFSILKLFLILQRVKILKLVKKYENRSQNIFFCLRDRNMVGISALFEKKENAGFPVSECFMGRLIKNNA